MSELPGLSALLAVDARMLLPVAGLLLLMLGFARRSDVLTWVGAVGILALPALGVVDWVLAQG